MTELPAQSAIEGLTVLPTDKRQTKYVPPSITKSDSSVHPSYTNLVLPYRVICRIRYAKATRTQRNQFMSEITKYEALQWKALDGVRVHRIYCDPVLSPPSQEELIKLTPDEERRLQYLIEH